MRLTGENCLDLYDALMSIRQPEFEDIKDLQDRDEYLFKMEFSLAIAKNRRKLKDTVESFREASGFTDEFKKYQQDVDNILQKYADKDTDGHVREKIEVLPGGRRNKSYHIPSLLVSDSKVNKELQKLEKENKEIIKIQEKRVEDINRKLKEEIEVDIELVPELWIPKGLQPSWLYGLMFMIKEK